MNQPPQERFENLLTEDELFKLAEAKRTICSNLSGVKLPEQDAVYRKQQNEYSNETQSQPATN